MAKIPNWIQDLVIDALVYAESKGHKAEIPAIHLMHKSNKCSSGSANYAANRICICLGKNRVDAKLVILHELAHLLCGKIGKQHHPKEFWQIAWDLYAWAKLPVRYTVAREKSYRKTSKVVYDQIRKSKKGTK